MSVLVLSAAAYKLKESYGGGYRAVVMDNRSQERHKSEVFATVHEARNWARKLVEKLMGGQPWAPGYIYRPDWVMNVWVR